MGRNEMCYEIMSVQTSYIFIFFLLLHFFLYIFSIFTLLSLSETNLFSSPTVKRFLNEETSMIF